MSEQTPTSTENLNGAEPSMEDILASIRKIISEDEPVAMESPEDVPSVDFVSAGTPVLAEVPSSIVDNETNFTTDTVLETVNVGAGEGSVDLNVDDVLAGLGDDDLDDSDSFLAEDLQIPEIPADATEDFSIESVIPEPDVPDVNTTELENDDDVFAFLDSKSAGIAGAAAAMTGVAGAVIAGNDVPEESPEISDLLEAVNLEEDIADDFSAIEDSLLPEAVPETEIVSEDVEMDALLDDILLSPEDSVEDAPIENVVEDLIPEELHSEEVVEEMELEAEEFSDAEQSDLELVKSLMAELADDPNYEEIGDLETSLDVEDTEGFEPEDVSLEEVDAPEDLLETSAEDDDILDDILDMSLEDELQDQPDDLGDLDLGDLASLDDVAAAEEENILENIFEDDAPLDSTEDSVGDVPSLAEIAAAAAADAAAVETSAGLQPAAAAIGLTAAGAGLAALTTQTADDAEADIQAAEPDLTDIEVAEVETSAPELSSEIKTTKQTKSLPTEESSMPVKAVKTEAIIDDVTETATAGAFAELTQVVEDKAVYNERGPRIGDLVQDALRPMLKEWLDANLKGIVERAVTKEVKRISKGQ